MKFDKAVKRLHAFSTSTRVGVWPYISKQELIKKIKSNLEGVFVFEAIPQHFSGQAAIIFELLRQNPEKYIEICQSLYETGAFLLGDILVEPSQSLRNNKVRFNLSAVDWMLFATLLDTEPYLFNGTNVKKTFLNEISTPQAIAGWARLLLGYGIVEIANISLYGQIETLVKAQKIVNFGGHAFLLLDVRLIDSDILSKASSICWVSLLPNGITQVADATSNPEYKFKFHVYFSSKIFQSIVGSKAIEENLSYVVLVQ